MKFNDLDADGIKDLGEPGLNGWTIHLFNATGTVHLTQVTANGGKYSFTGLDDGTYTICEQVLVAIPPWLQTFPTALGPGIVACDPAVPADPAADNPTPGPLGYTVTVTSACTDAGCGCGQQVTDKDFGNVQLAIKSGVKWLDADGDHTRDLPQDVGLDGWVIHLFGTAVNGTPVHQTYTTAGGPADPGHYTFTVLPGTYTVCEQMQVPANPPWTQTFPTSGANCITAVDPAADNPTPGPLGYAIVLTGGEIEAANDFGNTQITVTPPVCPEDEKAIPTFTVDSTKLPSATNFWTVTDAYNAAKAASGAQIVGIYTPSTENIVIDTFANSVTSMYITECKSAKETGADTAKAVWDITSTKPVTINGPSVVGGGNVVGWLVESDGNTLKGIRADGVGIGIKVTGNGNTITGINDVGTKTPNTGHGIYVTGNNNTIGSKTIGNNGGIGLFLEGMNNIVKEAIETGNGAGGVQVTGTGNHLKKNLSSGNAVFQYNLVVPVIDDGDNQANGVDIPGPACSTFPGVGQCP